MIKHRLGGQKAPREKRFITGTEGLDHAVDFGAHNNPASFGGIM